MNYEYTDRSRLIYDELKDEKMRIGVLKDQTLRAVDEATAKILLSRLKLQRALENLERNSVEYKKIDKALKRLRIVWGELNMLKRDTYRKPMRFDEDYETMDQLIALVQKVRGIK
ncbi:hypothetical protein N9V12_02165 [Gammaproteobacteria bacterium]|nr:hypothetical protein [Gammaproteobacteria bacterium]